MNHVMNDTHHYIFMLANLVTFTLYHWTLRLHPVRPLRHVHLLFTTATLVAMAHPFSMMGGAHFWVWLSLWSWVVFAYCSIRHVFTVD